MSVLLTVQSLRKAFGLQVVLDDVSFAVEAGERIAIVGVNGAGKSTLMRCILDDDRDAGLITRARDLVVRYVPQEPRLDLGRTVADTLTDAARGEPWERREVAAALQLPPGEREVGTLSLGERRRVALAVAILDKPDLLALDEPTNHLDAATVEWLERHLVQRAGALLLVTHDRWFLDRVATRILELDRGTIYSYPGNYTEFLHVQAERVANDAERERKRASFVRREIEWIRKSPSARRTKDKGRIERYEHAVASAADHHDRLMQLRLPKPERLGKTILELHGVTLRRPHDGQALVDKLTLLLKPGDRVGIIGPNGAGKSTLLRAVLGERAPDAGEVVRGLNTKIRYLDQARAELDDRKTVVEEVAQGNDHVMLAEGPVHVATFLRRLLFDDRDANRPVGTLSGGERNRLMLAKLLREPANLLILDEPTNDLDLMTMGVLEDALAHFGGCVLVVSHDRWFLDKVATGILAFEGDGRVVFYEGDYQSWAARRPEPAKAAPEAPRKPTEVTLPRSAPTRARMSYKEQRELEGMEAAILEAEAEVEALSTALAQTTGPRVAELSRALEAAMATVEQRYARWTELEAKAQGA
jgi:ATP-binding cassette subfamily F protein uup